MGAFGPNVMQPDSPDSRLGSWTARALALLLFFILSIGMTYPLALSMRSRVPGPPWDDFSWMYHMGRLRHGLVELGAWPTSDPAVFYPFGSRLPLSDLMLANQALIAPFLFGGDEVLGYNALVLLTFVLTGYTTYLLVAYLTDNRYAAVVAGAVFAFCPYRVHAMSAGWLPLVSTQWIPLVFLYLERTFREHKARHAWSAGLFMGLNCLSSWYYGCIVAVLAIAYLLVRRPWRAAFHHTYLLRNLALTGAVALVMVVPVALERAWLGPEAGAAISAEAQEWAPNLEDFFLPNVYHPVRELRVLGQDEVALRRPWEAPGHAYLGAVSMLLAAVGVLTAHKTGGVRRAYLLVGAISLALGLGGFLHWMGQAVGLAVPAGLAAPLRRIVSPLWSGWALRRGVSPALPLRTDMVPIPLPGLLVYWLVSLGTAVPLLRGFGVITAFALSVLAGMGAAQILGGSRLPVGAPSALEGYPEDTGPTIRRRAAPALPLLTPLLLGLVLFDFLSAPLAFGMSDVRIQPLDLWLAAQPEETVVMEYPLSRALSGISLYRGKYHGKRMAYGHAKALPEQFRYAMPLLASFPSEECLSLLSSWSVTHVVVASRAYDEGWGDAPGQSWEGMRAQIEASARLHLVGVTREDPVWRDKRVSYPILEAAVRMFGVPDKIYVYELK